MAAEPWEGCIGSQHTISGLFCRPISFLINTFLLFGPLRTLFQSCFGLFCVFGAVFCGGGTVCAGGVLSLFLWRLWQPWRSSIFSAARLCLPDRRRTPLGLLPFFNKIISYLKHYCTFYSILFDREIIELRVMAKFNLIVLFLASRLLDTLF